MRPALLPFAVVMVPAACDGASLVAGKSGPVVSAGGSAFRQATVVPVAQCGSSPFFQGTEAKYKVENLAHYARVLDRKLRMLEHSVRKCCDEEECAIDLCEELADLMEQDRKSVEQAVVDPEGDMLSRQRAVKQYAADAAQHQQTKDRYDSLVGSCHEQRLKHEQLLALLETQKRVVARRLGRA